MADLNTVEKTAMMVLKDAIGDANPTEEDIHNSVVKVSILFSISQEEIKSVEKQLQSNLQVRMDLGKYCIEEKTYHPWLANRKAYITPYYWKRYYDYLLIEEGWNEDVVKKLGQVSDTILDLCGNPFEDGAWKRKGLILGDIQSGKTSNYLALCNKAADAGYKIIILLTGTLESLRKQTQERVDAGFVGLNSRNILQKNPEKKFIGVGEIDSNRTAYQFTSVLSDFNSTKLQALNFTIKGLAEPVILVLKKNKSILENLAVWLSTRNTSNTGEKIDLPLLLIDDEADNASVNTNKPEKDPTAINAAICQILRLFSKSSYVGVTATPFANIFIDPDLDKGTDEFNLFPSDFIYSLSAPTNYIGARSIFSEDGKYYDSIETIDDVLIDSETNYYYFKSKAKTNHIVPGLPNSLKRAVKYFLLINAVRDLDGRSTTHRSMLVNVSQYVNVQSQVYEILDEYLKDIQLKIQSYSKLPYDEAMSYDDIKDFHSVWNEFNLEKITGHKWENILSILYESTAPVELRLVNQKSKGKGVERLDYEPYKCSGLRVIAVGGNSLSRGLTLEGLCVSYFDRNSQMYDTLMQMGRWFGYRKGYENLFKIWMEPDAISWYQYISTATDELRDEIDEMRRVGLTPKEFGLKVQENKTSLFVTARNKMRATTKVEHLVSLAAEVIETPRLIANKEKCLNINLGITNNLLTSLENQKNLRDTSNYLGDNRVVYKNVDKNIIADYVRSFVSHPRHIPFNSKDISEYIRKSSYFDKWTVALIGGSGELIEKKFFSDEVCNLGIRYSKRRITKDDNCLLISGNMARVGVPGATKYGLTEEEISNVEIEFKNQHPSVQTVPDKPYLHVDGRNPILLIYLIKIDKEKKADLLTEKHRKFDSDDDSIKLVGDMPVIAIGIGFPGSVKDSSEKILYVLNRVGEKEMINFEEDDENEDD